MVGHTIKWRHKAGTAFLGAMGGKEIKFTMCYLSAIWRQSNEAYGGHYDSAIGWKSDYDLRLSRTKATRFRAKWKAKTRHVDDCAEELGRPGSLNGAKTYRFISITLTLVAIQVKRL